MNEKRLQQRADSTRAKILRAARKLFVEHGFAGISVEKIAASAGINHSLIFHHFTNKEGLWKAVKQTIVEENNTYSPVLPKLNQSWVNFLRKLLLQSIQFYRSNPDIIRMINWQRLEYQHTQKIGITASTETTAWINAVKHYQNTGEINGRLKPEFILTMILSIVSSAAMDPNIFITATTHYKAYITFCVERLSIALRG